MLAVGIEAIAVEQSELDVMSALEFGMNMVAAEHLDHEMTAAVDLDGVAAAQLDFVALWPILNSVDLEAVSVDREVFKPWLKALYS
jgi:hypothetical protein